MSKHTPGPWGACTTDDKIHVVGGSDGDLLVMLYRNPTNEQISNAHLIAAAPELLEALKDAASALRYMREAHGELYGVGFDRVETNSAAAIAKAEGAQ